MAFPWQEAEPKDDSPTPPRKPVIYWTNVFKFAVFHTLALYALLFEVRKCKLITILFAYSLYLIGKCTCYTYTKRTKSLTIYETW